VKDIVTNVMWFLLLIPWLARAAASAMAVWRALRDQTSQSVAMKPMKPGAGGWIDVLLSDGSRPS
jgi:hypothetical protein